MAVFCGCVCALRCCCIFQIVFIRIRLFAHISRLLLVLVYTCVFRIPIGRIFFPFIFLLLSRQREKIRCILFTVHHLFHSLATFFLLVRCLWSLLLAFLFFVCYFEHRTNWRCFDETAVFFRWKRCELCLANEFGAYRIQYLNTQFALITTTLSRFI